MVVSDSTRPELQLALTDGRLVIAERCCAALGDTARAMFLRKVCFPSITIYQNFFIKVAPSGRGQCLYLNPALHELVQVNQVADEAQRNGLEDGNDHFMVKARMAMLDKQFARAEQILLEQVAATHMGGKAANCPY